MKYHFKRSLIYSDIPANILSKQFQDKQKKIINDLSKIRKPNQIIPIYSKLFRLHVQYTLLSTGNSEYYTTMEESTIGTCIVVENAYWRFMYHCPPKLIDNYSRSIHQLKEKILDTIRKVRKSFHYEGKTYNLNRNIYFLYSCIKEGLINENDPIIVQSKEGEKLQNILLNAIYDTIQNHEIRSNLS